MSPRAPRVVRHRSDEPDGHGHGHGDDGHAHHGHAHHDHAHHDAPRNAPLAPGEGQGRVLFLDAPSGLAGDMIVATLLDLGVPGDVVVDAIRATGLTGFHLHVGTRVRSGIVATSFDVHVDAPQPERTYGEIRRMLEAASLEPEVRRLAEAAFLALAQAEAKVHRAPLEDVHFHEVGGVDALCDVVGAAAAFAHLGARVLVSPLPMGRGFVKARHGVLPLPAPAVVEALAGFETYDAGIDAELVTPTGAALVAAVAEASVRWPTLRPARAGWGAGTRELPDRPNLLRAVLGDADAPAADGTHVVLEANVDDATGELVGAAIATLLAEGALDAWATPATMKKGRPAFVVAALAARADEQRLAGILLRETSSLGVRRHGVARVERPRRLVEVETAYGRLPVKVSEGPFGPPQRKPEFDACLAAARAHGVPVRVVLEAALAAAAAHG